MAHEVSEANYRWHDVNLGRRTGEPPEDHEMDPAHFRWHDLALHLDKVDHSQPQ